MLGPGNGNDVLALGQYPGEGELRRGTALLACQTLDGLGELEVALQVSRLRSEQRFSNPVQS